MTDMVRNWQNLAPGDLPTKHLDLMFSDFNPKENLASFGFAGFVHMNREFLEMHNVEASSVPSGLDDVSYYRDSYSAARSSVITGQNYYGPMFFIEIGVDSIALEDYCVRDAVCQETSMRLLKHLAIELNLKFQWQAYSWYYDSHERSEIRQGTEEEIRALFNADT